MAYDKIVDSSVLDSGLTAVANSIRAKTGKSGTLAFPNGMVSAIGEIAGELKYATGTITPTSYNETITVSGLAFAPKHIIVWFSSESVTLPNGNPKYFGFMQCGIVEASTGRTASLDRTMYSLADSNITLQSTGFKISGVAGERWCVGATYSYLAIG